MYIMIYGLILLGLITFVFFWLRYLNKVEQENATLKMKLAFEENYEEQTEESMGMIRKYKHDLKKHIDVMEHLKAKDSSLLEIIFAMKEHECRQKEISCNFQIKYDCSSVFSPKELTSLLVNLLDNAIEENEKINEKSQRKITCIIEKVEETLLIVLENTYRQGRELTFHSEKENSEEHGFGTKIIEEILRNMKGNINYRENTSKCSVKAVVTIPLIDREELL